MYANIQQFVENPINQHPLLEAHSPPTSFIFPQLQPRKPLTNPFTIVSGFSNHQLHWAADPMKSVACITLAIANE